jgi:signal transduction histidine kinase/GAF domain-containing protein
MAGLTEMETKNNKAERHNTSNKFQRKINAIVHRGVGKSQDKTKGLIQELTQSAEQDEIMDKLRHFLVEEFDPSQVHIYLFDPQSDQFTATPGADGIPTSDLRFGLEDPLVVMLSQGVMALILDSPDSLPGDLRVERNRLALLGAHVFIPLAGQEKLVGWLALGPKFSDQNYTQEDISLLESLSKQVALVVGRTLVVKNLERRVKEMDVLTQVAQGVNITIEFDDMLELIYAQTSYVIPGDDFRVTLSDSSSSGTLRHVFFLENDERIRDKEDKPLPENQTLAYEIVHRRQVIRADDYELQCRSCNVIPDSDGINAWLGVPLNAGAETIGAISIGSRDPAVSYTDQQSNLLQAIADQTASAIIKSRLLIETERRARQLATLNEIGRSLTSTLEIKPLLNQILKSATEILNCEAGSLFMVDEPTGDLIFEVTVGPVADDLVGRHLPAGTGIAGKVADTGQPAIVNDAQKSSGWFGEPDKKTGFITRDLLVVPMQIKERVTGVIEVINKIDGSPFSEDDQELLTTFGIQAAIAVENARLYTQTDEALSARVEEMSILQRIDRELNASLNLNNTLQITLDWSIRQSKSDAGLIGLIDKSDSGQGDTIRIMAHQGYTTELDQFSSHQPSEKQTDYVIPLNSPDLQTAIKSGEPKLVTFGTPIASPSDEKDNVEKNIINATHFSLLDTAQTQLLFPIKRKLETIATLLLESKTLDAYSEDIFTFLSSQLFAEVEEANKAKSEFVSLVSHELKTPMTSIRGYTDLLAQGNVGPVNEIQTNFLSTIRSNVDRMATLVSDLADISRIETGRMRLEFSAVSLTDIVEEVVRSARAQIIEKDQTLNIIIPEDLPKVWGDYNRIIQILNNLLSNANKYTPQSGKITINAEQQSNKWDPDGAPEVVLLDVQDTGYGISPGDQGKIFQKFFRSEDENIREIPGTGLGLNITRHLVEMQGGRIWFESKEGRGTTFSFTVPVAATD